ncbi:hypothetical protein YC2023_025091 [Brassica napus]
MWRSQEDHLFFSVLKLRNFGRALCSSFFMGVIQTNSCKFFMCYGRCSRPLYLVPGSLCLSSHNFCHFV